MPNLICSNCGQTYDLNERRWRCQCGFYLDIDMKFQFKPDQVKHHLYSLWRYRQVIPLVQDENIVSMDEGFTPLSKITLARKQVWIKSEHLSPSGSFKDRGASVMVSKIKELAIDEVVEDSSGNAGAAIAAYCARAKIRCRIFVPKDTPQEKVTQIKAYGAFLNLVNGSRQDTAEAALAAAESSYYASHYWNPFFFQGTKTFAYELCEQLGWRNPQTLILPVGHGTLFLGAYWGFKELAGQGIIKHLPRMIAVQAQACSPLSGMKPESGNGVKTDFIPQETLAEGIAIAQPLRWRQITQAIQESRGMIIQVTELEIKKALKEMIAQGYYIEPTAAAAVAGTIKYLADESGAGDIVTVFTGHGLKSAQKISTILG